ncbi:BZIP transcription factor family protein [Striga asiatica]|uniref:BZIP transcription factor family protein n=1 Tax=Striga asiatica TaxID=4170 RepID=A0A5A7R3E6_STRAF|nr:BZIP transcription factor family protein [Striga asiatica]
MADSPEVAVDRPPPSPPYRTGNFDPCLHNPPLDATFFSEDLLIGEGGPNADDEKNSIGVLEGLDFDFSFDDLCLPISDDLDQLLEPALAPISQSGSDPNIPQLSPNFDQFQSVFKSTSEELRHLLGDNEFLGDQNWEGSGVLSSSSPEMESQQISGYLNMPSPESNGSNRDSTENCGSDADEKVLKCNSLESEGSGNCGGGADEKVLECNPPESEDSGNFISNVSEDTCATRSVSSSPNSSNSSIGVGVVDQKIKLEEPANNNGSTSLKRKNEGEDLGNDSIESRTNKYRKSSNSSLENHNTSGNNNGVPSEEEEKRKARLLRNRESAQLSRQRKKHYVEELEDKVKTMHSTIQDLNAKITFFMAENATLRQQMGSPATGAPPPPPMAPPPPGMYPHPAMMYPWMPCPPPYMVKPQGSQVPLVPIPRLKKKQPAPTPKTSNKVNGKKNEAPKTKRVASVSFLGLLFFIMLFGGLVPIFNTRYGGVREAFTGGDGYIGNGLRGRVLMVNGTEYGQPSGGDPGAGEFVRSGNGSEPLAASLYVPRNDKLVKIDGNLIIHSVLATEKAMSSHGKGSSETGLVVSRDLPHARPVPGVGINGARHPQLRALGSGSVDNDGSLQQWFREGLAGPMLSSGLCTEVFQFDVSAAGAIIPAGPSTTRNVSKVQTQNSTNPTNKARNRRILHPVHLPEPSHHNISTEQSHAGENQNPKKENLKNTSSMVVSVLFDPREAVDADVDGVMRTKSLSRIFVVVLIDSVKYVTYSCMLPFAGSGPHLVTA